MPSQEEAVVRWRFLPRKNMIPIFEDTSEAQIQIWVVNLGRPSSLLVGRFYVIASYFYF